METLDGIFLFVADIFATTNQWLSANTWATFFIALLSIMVITFIFHWLNVFATRTSILKAIVKNDLEGVLNNLSPMTVNVLDEGEYWHSVKDFLAQRLTADSFYAFYETYNNLRGRGKKETRWILKRIFSGRHASFWSNLYYRELLAGKNEEVEKLTTFFESFEPEYEKKIWHGVWRELNRYNTDLAHTSNQELSEKAADKMVWAKLLAEEEYLAVV